MTNLNLIQVGSIGNVIKANLYKSEESIYKRFDAKYKLYRDLNLTMNDALNEAYNRRLIMYENRQMLEYRIRKDYTNK